eukprot:374814-Amphidinium_carterae.2
MIYVPLLAQATCRHIIYDASTNRSTTRHTSDQTAPSLPSLSARNLCAAAWHRPFSECLEDATHL